MSQQHDEDASAVDSDGSAKSNRDSAFGLGMFPENGPFMRGVHQTPPSLWLSVLLIFLGVSSLGVSFVSLHYAGSALGWSTLIGGVVLTLAGIGLGLRNKILQDVT